jgi:hypothetical protein
MAHICNPRYLGGRDQEDHGSKPAWANSLWDPIEKKIHHKKGLVEWGSRCRPWVQAPLPQQQQKNLSFFNCLLFNKNKSLWKPKACGVFIFVINFLF